MESVLQQASLYLAAAVLVVPLALRAGLGSVLGYLAAGILLGPVFGLAGAETTDLQHVAEFGVVMMLFLIGLELEPRVLWAMRHKLIGLGGLQVVGTSGLIAAVLYFAGMDWRGALTVGMLLSLSSTAIVLQSLEEQGLVRGPGGRSAFSVLLTQDLAVIPMLALIPLLALPGAEFAAGTAHETQGSLTIPAMQYLPGWAAALLTLGIVAGIVAGGHFLSRPMFRFVHASRLPEMSTFFSLLLVFGVAFLMELVGLSPALGTFLAGVVLANSEFRHQIEADIKPFKGLLLGLFFMTVGIGIDFQVLMAAPLMVLGLTLALILGKAVVLLAAAIVFRIKGRDRWLFVLALAQGGEFGFLVVSFSRSEGILSDTTGQMVLLVISLSMLFTPLLFILYTYLARRLAATMPKQPADEITEKGRVIIAGMGRFGQVVNRLVRSSGLSTIVLDSDPATIETMRGFGVQSFFGDPSRPELLAAAGLQDAEVLVVAVDDRETANRIVRFARAERPDLHIIARAHDRVHVYELYQAGASDIVREMFDSSVRAGRYVLENMGFTEYEASQLSQAFFQIDRAGVRELAGLWVPGQPVHLNKPYVERAKELSRDLETALIAELDNARPKDRAAE